MKESKILESFIPERRCEEADKPESVTRLPEGAILVNPYGLEDYTGAFYYQDYQSYLDDEPYIREFMKKQYRKPATYGQHFYIEYDDTDPDHRSVREHSFLVMTQYIGNKVLLNGVAATFKEAVSKKNLTNRLILPLKVLELSTDIFSRPSKRAILRDVYKDIKRRRLYVKH